MVPISNALYMYTQHMTFMSPIFARRRPERAGGALFTLKTIWNLDVSLVAARPALED